MSASICIVYDNSQVGEMFWDYLHSHFQNTLDGPLYLLGDPDAHVGMRSAVLIDTADDLPPTGGIGEPKFVVLAPAAGRYVQGDESLATFIHPQNAIYLVGSNSRHLSEDDLGSRVPDHKVFIPTDTNDEMFAQGAAIVTLWDRRAKGG